MDDMKKDLGERMRISMIKQGITGRGLAKMINVEPLTISNYVNGKTFPREHNLNSIAAVLGVTPEYLLHGTHVKKSTYYKILEWITVNARKLSKSERMSIIEAVIGDLDGN